MMVSDCHIIEDEGTRILVGGKDDTGRQVAFHVTLTSERGIELATRLREDPDSVRIELPAPSGAENAWTEDES